VDGERAPTYYLHSDAPLYYYSFTDAWIAMAYKSLTKEQQARFDPMITGFNPADMRKIAMQANKAGPMQEERKYKQASQLKWLGRNDSNTPKF